MIRILSVKFQNLLYRDSDRCASAPDADDMSRGEIAVRHLHAKAEGIGQQVISRDVDFGICQWAVP